ncbi:bifunctional metallophosphatase/5'-nucleotidase [Kiloniella sp. b19]|uniref:bifunctional metallophosphatase/5'-nucleotidase n=1 Tax=Kiloniella sp. GXU_MW_B19 TaxID=3141326 RepID=UPI0031D685BC
MTLRNSMFSLLAGAATSALLTTSAFAENFTLHILHTNDLHSRIEAVNKYDSTCSGEDAAEGKCFGGVARLKTAIEERRNALKGENVLLLDAGDQFQGSLFYSTYKGKAAVEFMNAMDYDVMALGNHEFDDGPEGLKDFLDQAEFPVISGNTEADEASGIKGAFRDHVILEIGGEKIAIVSVLAEDTVETSSPGEHVEIHNAGSYLLKTVEELEGQGINKIIALTHVGLLRDISLAGQVRGLDVVVGGHSHTLLSNTDPKASGPYPVVVKNEGGYDVPVVQAYAYSKYLGEIKIVFDEKGQVVSATGEPLLLDASIAEDETVRARVAELAQPLDELKRQVVGKATETIDGSRENCRSRECAMGNLVTDAMLERVRDQGVSFAIQNGGGLRASIEDGTVTMGDVLTVLPFQNTLATFKIKGGDVIRALENGVGQIEEGAGRFPQVAGLRYSVSLTAEPGQRVSGVEVNENGTWELLDSDKLYGVVTNNYLRSGGDGYAVFAEEGQEAYDYGPSLEDVVADYLKGRDSYQPYTDGRITVK